MQLLQLPSSGYALCFGIRLTTKRAATALFAEDVMSSKHFLCLNPTASIQGSWVGIMVLRTTARSASA